MDNYSAPASGNGFGSEEDPAAAFLAQQENEIAGIENDEGYGISNGGQVQSSFDGADEALNGDFQGVSNGPSDNYAAVAQADRLQGEPESLRRWREEQRDRLEALDATSRTQEAEWKDRAKVDLEEWYCRQDEQLEKAKVNNRVLDEEFYKQPLSELIGYVTHINHPCYRLDQAAEEATAAAEIGDDNTDPGTEWQRVARLCDFSPKSSKQSKDVSRMRSVLISLKEVPLVH
ncbi:clathrin light chain A-like isoform X1 [Brienomyrus brachyistius]|uniref:clathrin light chain A-like isoform X1 n=1 Tax=Brienomyrus brachyistius TaxID=42636 RepID=UPI0020B36D56|nr:clathrin light chain A-like isoform X1 [Brienomyrus brachyistius]